MEAFLIGLSVFVLGLAFALAGYQFFRVLIPIWGFFAGFTWGAQAIAIGLGTGFLATVTGWVVGFIFALVIAVLAYTFYELAVGILGASIGYWATAGLLTAIGFSPNGFLTMLLAIAAGVALGVAVIYFKAPKGLLIALSAFGGSTAAIGGLLVMFGAIPVALLGTGIVSAIIGQSFLWILAWISMVAVGIATQIGISRSMVGGDDLFDYTDDVLSEPGYTSSSYRSSTLAGSKGGSTTKETTTENTKTVEKVQENK